MQWILLDFQSVCPSILGSADLEPMYTNAPMTLKLFRDIVKVHPHTQFPICVPNDSAVRAQTHRTDSITLTADAGGTNKHLVIAFQNLPVTKVVDALMEMKSSPDTDDYRYFDPKLIRATQSSVPRNRQPFQEVCICLAYTKCNIDH